MAHLMERSQRSEDRSSEPGGVNALGRRSGSVCVQVPQPSSVPLPVDNQGETEGRRESRENARILIFIPGANWLSSLCNRSTKPGISVVPPVTTTLLSSVAWRSGSIWTSELRIRPTRGCRAE